MALMFVDSERFATSAAAVAVGSAVAGLCLSVLLPPAAVSAAGAATFLGGSLAAAATLPSGAWGMSKRAHWLMGLGVGVGSALLFLVLKNGVGLPPVLSGALSALGLGAVLLQGDGLSRWGKTAGAVAAAAMGAVGLAGLDNVARFLQSEGVSPGMATMPMAALLGLWVAAATGLGRLQQQRDALQVRTAEVLATVIEPIASKVRDAVTAHADTRALLGSAPLEPELLQQAQQQNDALLSSVLEIATTWHKLKIDIENPRVQGLTAKLQEIDARVASTDDAITRGHLERAQSALRAQVAAVDGLKLGAGRAEAAVDVQTALLDRLRLAATQHERSERERFSVEVTAIADDAARVSDDLQGLTTAMAEAEVLADRRFLADLERSGRRAVAEAVDVAAVSEPVRHRR